MRDTFVDPKTGDSYEWDIGHTDEEPNGKSRQISESANTGNTGLVKQQGDTQPLVNKYSGTILTLDQFEEMWHWFNLCETQTVIFKDFAGEEFGTHMRLGWVISSVTGAKSPTGS